MKLYFKILNKRIYLSGKWFHVILFIIPYFTKLYNYQLWTRSSKSFILYVLSRGCRIFICVCEREKDSEKERGDTLIIVKIYVLY